MGAPAGKAGMSRVRFGATGKPVAVPTASVAAARAGKGKVYEDGSYKPNPAPRAVERANPNASFKRPAVTTPKASPPAAARPTMSPTAQRPMPAARTAPAQQRSFLPKPPAKASKPVLRR